MIIAKLELENFRNFPKKQLEFEEQISVIIADNAAGKTNILEAVYLLATGKSFKARVEGEMIGYGEDVGRVKGIVDSSWHLGEKKMENPSTIAHPQSTNLEVVLTNGEIKLHGGGVQKAQKKKLLVNGVAKRLIDFSGNLKVVLFGPWDMDLVTASPSLRRRFLDSVLSQTDREYRRSVMIYEKGLRQRNRLLFRIREEGVSRGQLMYWDKLLIKHGQYITEKREGLIDYINNQNSQLSIISQSPEALLRTGRFSELEVRAGGNYQLEYDRSAISEGRLKQYENEEAAAATTLVGPHRDDFVVKVTSNKLQVTGNKKKSRNLRNEEMKNAERNLAIYGSRGEQRMGVLWMKLAELSYIEQVTGDRPVLLLDDIFSELDHEHREIVMEIVGNQQTIITTADPHYVVGVKGQVVKL